MKTFFSTHFDSLMAAADKALTRSAEKPEKRTREEREGPVALENGSATFLTFF
jgi:hypothetical protein